MEPPAEKGTPERREVRQVVKEQGERVETARENFRIAQEEFVAAAHAAGGARLPPD
jgi:type IV secretory pathway VirD2 relaxase